MMQKYVLLARVSNEFASAMLNKPQDRLEIVEANFKRIKYRGMRISLYIR